VIRYGEVQAHDPEDRRKMSVTGRGTLSGTLPTATLMWRVLADSERDLSFQRTEGKAYSHLASTHAN
jgi:hypothetical protein